MSEINCNSCNELKVTSPNFTQNGITETECTSLAADTGLNPNISPKHNDEEDLHNMNDCLVGRMEGDLEKFNVCDWQDFMRLFIPNIYELLKGIICAVGGIWKYIHNLLSRVSNLENRMTSVEGRVAALESWKQGIDSWKATIDTWKGSVDKALSDLSTALSPLANTVAQHTQSIQTLNTNYNNISNTVGGHTTQITNINRKIDEIIASMGGDEDEMPVMKRYRYVVPAGAFGRNYRADHASYYNATSGSWEARNPNGLVMWFSGAGNNEDVGEMWIRIPITEMDNITGVWTQTWVVPSGNSYDGRGKPFIQTVNVQEWYQEGDYLIINFDVLILSPEESKDGDTVKQNGGPYPVTVDFLVVGKKAITI